MTQFSRFFKKLAGGWGKIGIVIPILAVFLMSQNTAAYTGSVEADRIILSRPSGNLYITNWNGNKKRSDYYSIAAGTDGSINQFAARKLNQSWTSDPYQTLQIQFDMFVEAPVDANPILGCPKRAADSVIYVQSCDIEKNSYVSGSNVYVTATYTIKVLYARNYSASTDFEVFLNGSFLSYDSSKSIKYAFSQPVLTAFVDINDRLYQALVDSNGETTQAVDDLKSSVDAQNQLENNAVNDIQTQSGSGFGDISSPVTTNLIGVLSSFLSSLSSITPSTTCDLDLPFPAFAGGNWHVNPCQLPSQAVSVINIISSIIAIFFFIPLVTLLLKMIYNEIRSFQS